MKRSTKKFIGAVAVTAGMLGVANNVYASDLTGSISVSGLDVIDYKKSYDQANDLNNVHLSITVNNDLINHILSQRPGNATESASLGSFLLKVEPGIVGNVKKDNMSFEKNVAFADMKTALDPEADAEATVNYSTVWINGIKIQYNDGTGWQKITNKGDGTLSIGANLAEKLGVQESELKYSVNFRFTMTETKNYLYEWKKEDGTREYIQFSYEVKFPVNAKLEDGNYAYYPSVEDALKSESKEITVNEDVTMNEDVVLPKDVKLIVADGATLTVAAGKKLTYDEGNVVGTVVGDKEEIKAPVTEDPTEPTNPEDPKEDDPKTDPEEKPNTPSENPKTLDAVHIYTGLIVTSVLALIALVKKKLS